MATLPGGLPPELDPRHWQQTGAQVLDNGPPDLPAQLTDQMWIPLCCWAAETCGVVTFMLFLPHPEDGHMRAMTTLMRYAREEGRWIPPQGNTLVASSIHNGFNPLTDPDDRRHLDGSTMTRFSFDMCDTQEPGHSASIVRGHVSSEVKYLAIIQDGQQYYRPLKSHFGEYVVCLGEARPLRRRRLRQRRQAPESPFLSRAGRSTCFAQAA